MEVISFISEEEGLFLVKLARKSIEHYLKNGQILHIPPDSIPYDNLKKLGACFITLETKHGSLRGCIGSVIPHKPLYEDVIHNSVSAAVSDPRFNPLSLDELDGVRIKVSVLTYPQSVKYEDWTDLLQKIQPYRDGIIIRYKNHSATFLPDVWKDLPDKHQFLSHLCLKAGLKPDCYRELKLEVFKYQTLLFKE